MVRVTAFTFCGTAHWSLPALAHTQPLPKTVPVLPHMGGLRHRPPTQLWPLAQALPQAPQLATSAFTSFSQPVPGSLSQLPQPLLQASEQTELTHAATAFCPPPMHTLPQTPQFFTSLASFASQPVWALLSQSA